ncbi:MAG: ABC transporter substrate-binding protein [Treponema sp.]|uniref:ABC transporter substrate-binding protein n=1 Tax=Treponema sp. TaxID=166 RepID=UPI00298E35C1|nr:ABC transporter substrate-binding protein [Treponema sp.]MCR5386609.1 ABC transporter substrate-binding protein [Treponema sp.]
MKKSAIGSVVLAALLAFTSCGNSKSNDIVIGGIFPLSGAVAVYGVECKNGIDLAIEEINAAGGVNGQKLVLVSEDDEGNPDKTVNAYQKLTSKNNAKIIIGSLTSGCTQAITARCQAQKVLQIAPAATAPAITDAGDYIFRACFIDPFQGTVGGKFAAENLSCKKAAILFDTGNDYSVGLTENFEKSFVDCGGQIVAKEAYTTNDKDFNAQLTKIKNANPDVVYLPDYYGVVALIAKQLRAKDINCCIVGADGWDGVLGNAGEEVLNGFYSNHYAADSTEPAVQKFVSAFNEKYEKDPNAFAALGYDSVYLLKDAISRAGTADATAVKAALEATDGNYVTGHLTFDEKHNPVKSAVMLEIVKADDGTLATVYKATVNP